MVPRQCMKCGGFSAWHLKDGRLKCKNCGTKFSWKTVWEGCRLPEDVKIQLLEQFVRGVSAYRMTVQTPISSPARERFVRLIRATLAYQEHCRKPFVVLKGTSWPGVKPGSLGLQVSGPCPHLIGVGLTSQEGFIRVSSLHDDPHVWGLVSNLWSHTPLGTLYFVEDRRACLFFRIRSSHVLFGRKQRNPSQKTEEHEIRNFWRFALQWLAPYRGIQRKFFHLYLGEVAYRFNHREQDLFPIILDLMHRTPLPEIRTMLVHCR